MFAGEGTPERTNRRFHYLSLGQEAARLSTAFDSVTLYGEDPHERPDIYGKVGNSGVSIATKARTAIARTEAEGSVSKAAMGLTAGRAFGPSLAIKPNARPRMPASGSAVARNSASSDLAVTLTRPNKLGRSHPLLFSFLLQSAGVDRLKQKKKLVFSLFKIA